MAILNAPEHCHVFFVSITDYTDNLLTFV